MDNRLTLLSPIEKSRPQKALYRCSCGFEKIMFVGNVKSGKSKSCGCLNLEMIKQRRLDNIEKFTTGNPKHGMAWSPTWRTWNAMIARCKYPSKTNYKYYGGRGISVCERWQEFAYFYEDMGDRPLDRTLDRINGNGNYEPSNCRWATKAEQSQNRRSPKKRQK